MSKAGFDLSPSKDIQEQLQEFIENPYSNELTKVFDVGKTSRKEIHRWLERKYMSTGVTHVARDDPHTGRRVLTVGRPAWLLNSQQRSEYHKRRDADNVTDLKYMFQRSLLSRFKCYQKSGYHYNTLYHISKTLASLSCYPDEVFFLKDNDQLMQELRILEDEEQPTNRLPKIMSIAEQNAEFTDLSYEKHPPKPGMFVSSVAPTLCALYLETERIKKTRPGCPARDLKFYPEDIFLIAKDKSEEHLNSVLCDNTLKSFKHRWEALAKHLRYVKICTKDKKLALKILPDGEVAARKLLKRFLQNYDGWQDVDPDDDEDDANTLAALPVQATYNKEKFVAVLIREKFQHAEKLCENLKARGIPVFIMDLPDELCDVSFGFHDIRKEIEYFFIPWWMAHIDSYDVQKILPSKTKTKLENMKMVEESVAQLFPMLTFDHELVVEHPSVENVNGKRRRTDENIIPCSVDVVETYGLVGTCNFISQEWGFLNKQFDEVQNPTDLDNIFCGVDLRDVVKLFKEEYQHSEKLEMSPTKSGLPSARGKSIGGAVANRRALPSSPKRTPVNGRLGLDSSAQQDVSQFQPSLSAPQFHTPPPGRSQSAPGSRRAKPSMSSIKQLQNTPHKRPSLSAPVSMHRAKTQVVAFSTDLSDNMDCDLRPLRKSRSMPTKSKLKDCSFGKRCTRTNPEHFYAMRHPLNHKFIFEYEQNREPCTYGGHCSKMEQLHFIAFEHPQSHDLYESPISIQLYQNELQHCRDERDARSQKKRGRKMEIENEHETAENAAKSRKRHRTVSSDESQPKRRCPDHEFFPKLKKLFLAKPKLDANLLAMALQQNNYSVQRTLQHLHLR